MLLEVCSKCRVQQQRKQVQFSHVLLLLHTAIQMMSSDDDILGMPEMSTREKMDKMSAQPKVEQLKRELGGSRSSLRSRTSLHSSVSGSLSDTGKEPR